ncbi:MAG: hypothetical protein LBS74_02865 [Oscillospiraceae bacterium]|nr:hypothetical protein [Oscillospiraceae bacterium]
MLFKKYANPFILLDQFIIIGGFSAFIEKLVEFDNNQSAWEFFLHKVTDKTYKEFKESLKNQPENFGATEQETADIINKFARKGG